MSNINILSRAEIKDYHEKGYLVLRGVFTEQEAKLFQVECDRLLSFETYTNPYNVRAGHKSYTDGSIKIERLDPVHDISPVFNALVKDERLLAPLRDIYSDEPLLFKDKLIFKLPGANGYSMHQDGSWWHGFKIEGLISVMVAIDGASKANGGLELFPGYHHRLLSPEGELRNMNEEEIAQIDKSTGQLVETNPGDVIIFHSFTPHQSGPNTSQLSRKQLFLTYSPSANGDLYRAHQQHYQRYALENKDISLYHFK
ncbi:Ectoine hydroxylase-related dioxygenase, phytanoyl-CoA dioxygenase (PhyH) family [Paenibacillus sp. UNCCL117]|uniref:phytanoyl-CoA dioxygenase family protein n=1 Tax=unclassified Paenibacillus TaxID=185978 RepID=UPI000886E13B|nr:MULTISPECIES: phytanoyl-CoA dioxygenase family protein [unclassified Paenibacillus]SDE27029.1 Ectoine hydroxylase-related dioxygenase, phytanoyl-CoA dioxygenase (PhyH) family [Paenibacillus sp. cl123]SFW62748.1 Ectoine hydroxylase-related dioxygenase, phytanoyl-CoA dioxygenase (PhyH) family [Paenibacillus sp. UNCCL117]